MTEPTAPPPYAQPALPGMPPYAVPAPKKSFVARLAAGVAAHAYLSLAVIVVLLVVAIGLYVYYHGLWVLGPWARPRGKGRRRAPEAAAEAEPADGAGDAETERLIDSINHR
jgi:hypothetical protein